ncbi:hypothetical protein PMZ80_010315 [Knufia obscura]|uniref:Uncharacterized protein n=2 Tax=Knufia TaxID=430999 RepID=A0AAN8EIT6_9EURO|nr:hypothetical protein PMZ80_010315 [Knufia obscura]KAK5951822.1 hypothetical protein OHC33_007114 [Knufia fluminis]
MRVALTEGISKDLSIWRAELARFLDADSFSTSLLIPIFQRQRNVLNLTYWHAVILTYRPFILSNFIRLSQRGSSASNENPQAEESVQQCLMAAMNTVNTIDDMTENRQMFPAFWVCVGRTISIDKRLTGYRLRHTSASPQLSYFTST